MREAHRLARIIKLLSPYNKTDLAQQIKQIPTILLGLEIWHYGQEGAARGEALGRDPLFCRTTIAALAMGRRQSRCTAQSLTLSEFTSSSVQEKIRGERETSHSCG
jgi:hypothetical protein